MYLGYLGVYMSWSSHLQIQGVSWHRYPGVIIRCKRYLGVQISCCIRYKRYLGVTLSDTRSIFCVFIRFKGYLVVKISWCNWQMQGVFWCTDILLYLSYVRGINLCVIL